MRATGGDTCSNPHGNANTAPRSSNTDSTTIDGWFREASIDIRTAETRSCNAYAGFDKSVACPCGP